MTLLVSSHDLSHVTEVCERIVVLDKGNELDWFTNYWVTGGTVFAVVMLIFMVIWEMTEDNPIINLKLFANRNFCVGTILLTLGYAGFFSINLILPQWLQSQMGYTALWAGLAAAPMGGVASVFDTYFR